MEKKTIRIRISGKLEAISRKKYSEFSNIIGRVRRLIILETLVSKNHRIYYWHRIINQNKIKNLLINIVELSL